MFGSRAQAATIWHESEHLCKDSLVKLVTGIALAQTLSLFLKQNATESKTVFDQLSDANRVTELPTISNSKRDKIRPAARNWVKHSWKEIDSTITENRYAVRDALTDHLHREFRLYFCKEDPDWIGGPYEEKEIKRLSLPSETHFLKSLAHLQKTNTIDEETVRDWIHRSVFTHYRNFREMWTMHGIDYVPAHTRSSLLLGMSQQEVGHRDWNLFGDVMHCVALDILRDAHSRSDIIKAAVRWSKSNKGRRVRDGFAQFRADYWSLSDTGRKNQLEKVHKIIDSPVGSAVNIFMGLVSILPAKLPTENLRLGTPQNLVWLWDIRNPDVHSGLRNAIKYLLPKN